MASGAAINAVKYKVPLFQEESADAQILIDAKASWQKCTRQERRRTIIKVQNKEKQAMDLRMWVAKRKIAWLIGEEGRLRTEIVKVWEAFAEATKQRSALIMLFKEQEKAKEKMGYLARKEASAFINLSKSNIDLQQYQYTPVTTHAESVVQWFVYKPPKEWIVAALFRRLDSGLRKKYFSKLTTLRFLRQRRRRLKHQVVMLLSSNQNVARQNVYEKLCRYTKMQRKEREAHREVARRVQRTHAIQRLKLEDQEEIGRSDISSFEGQTTMAFDFEFSKGKVLIVDFIKKKERDAQQRRNIVARLARTHAHEMLNLLVRRYWGILKTFLNRRRRLYKAVKMVHTVVCHAMKKLAAVYWRKLGTYTRKLLNAKWKQNMAESFATSANSLKLQVYYDKLKCFMKVSQKKQQIKNMKAKRLAMQRNHQLMRHYVRKLKAHMEERKKRRIACVLLEDCELALHLTFYRKLLGYSNIQIKKRRNVKLANTALFSSCLVLYKRYFVSFMKYHARQKKRTETVATLLKSTEEGIKRYTFFTLKKLYRHRRAAKMALALSVSSALPLQGTYFRKLVLLATRSLKAKASNMRFAILLTRRYFKKWKKTKPSIAAASIRYLNAFKAEFLLARTHRTVLRCYFDKFCSS